MDSDNGQLQAIRAYWNGHIHDLEIATAPLGSSGFFRELEAYRYDKLRYLPAILDSSASVGIRMLEIGCGVGTDLARFARAGAATVGIDLAEVAVDLARTNFQLQGLAGEFHVMNGEELPWDNESFDFVYAHGVLQYTADPDRMVREIHRVLKTGGQAVLMMYNRRSWLHWMSRWVRVPLEHEDAPVYLRVTSSEFRRLLKPFREVRIVPERFPVPTKLHGGLKALLYNHVFVRAFQWLPRRWVRPLGWHLVGFAEK